MPFYYLSPYVGDGSEQNRFKPRVADGDWVSIDFSSKAGGKVALVRTERKVTTSFGDLYLGDTLDAQLPLAVVRQLSNRLGVSLAYRGNLRGIVAELLIVQGREDGSRWRRLRATKGALQIWLRDLIYEMRPIMNAAYSESFNQADSTTLGPDLTWTEVQNDWGTVSNRATPQTNNSGSAARAEHDLSSGDHYVESLVRYATSVSGVVGVAARFDSSAQTYYRAALDSAGRLDITRTVNGSNTDLASQSRSIAANTDYLIRLECDGSTIRARVDSDAWLSTTDTQITGNTRFGMAGYRTNRDLLHDYINSADLYAPVPQRLIVGVGI